MTLTERRVGLGSLLREEFTPRPKRETKMATADRTATILRERIEMVLEGAKGGLFSLHPQVREVTLGSITSEPTVFLGTKRTKDEFLVTEVDKDTFMGVLSQLMEEYGVDSSKWRTRSWPWSWRWDTGDFLTKYPDLVFRWKKFRGEQGKVSFVKFSFVCTRPGFSLLTARPKIFL